MHAALMTRGRVASEQRRNRHTLEYGLLVRSERQRRPPAMPLRRLPVAECRYEIRAGRVTPSRPERSRLRRDCLRRGWVAATMRRRITNASRTARGPSCPVPVARRARFGGSLPLRSQSSSVAGGLPRRGECSVFVNAEAALTAKLRSLLARCQQALRDGEVAFGRHSRPPSPRQAESDHEVGAAGLRCCLWCRDQSEQTSPRTSCSSSMSQTELLITGLLVAVAGFRGLARLLAVPAGCRSHHTPSPSGTPRRWFSRVWA
jgi:hypothetical protein